MESKLLGYAERDVELTKSHYEDISPAVIKITATTEARVKLLGDDWGRVTTKSNHPKCMQVAKREYKQYLRNSLKY